eukprot:2172181-Amphidinium_carterae.1
MASASEDMVETDDTLKWSQWQSHIAKLPSTASTSHTPSQEIEATFAFAFAQTWMQTHESLDGASTA